MSIEMNIADLYKLFQEYPMVTTDSRHCPPESIFFALKGENFNGNAFASKALEAGCAYAVVDEVVDMDASDKRIVLVKDVLTTLQQLANYHRRKLGTKIIGITGTNGKTTTKELLSAVLMQKYQVLYTQGNLNNAIGVPLTLLRLTEKHDIAVVEMGASHPGDIKELVDIAEPDYGLITNVGMAHLQGFGSFEGVVHTKGELYDYLRTREDSLVFIHNDNTHLNSLASGLSLVRYGLPSPDNVLWVSGEVIDCAPYLRFRWRHVDGEWNEVQTSLVGSYNIDNMLAAAAVGLYCGVTIEQVNNALSNYIPQNNRSQLMHTSRNHLIVDAYNANPTSMMAALTNFQEMKVSPKMVILGDMKELGECSMEEHQRIANFLSTAGFDKVWLVGLQFGKVCTKDLVFADTVQVVQTITDNPIEGYYILIKGSNSMKLSQVVEYL